MTLRNYVKRVGPNNHPGISIFFRYVGCSATPRVRPGMFALLEKNDTFLALLRVNLNPIEDKKFLF